MTTKQEVHRTLRDESKGWFAMAAKSETLYK